MKVFFRQDFYPLRFCFAWIEQSNFTYLITLFLKIIPDEYQLKVMNHILQLLYNSPPYICINNFPTQSFNENFLNPMKQNHQIHFFPTFREASERIIAENEQNCRFILIGKVNESLLKQLEKNDNISHVYIMSNQQGFLKNTIQKYTKVKANVNNFPDLLNKISEFFRADNKKKQRQYFKNENSKFVEDQKKSLLQFFTAFHRKSAKKQFYKLVQFISQQEKNFNQSKELKIFQQEYPPDPPVQIVLKWLNKNNFYFNLTNQIIRASALVSQLAYVQLPYYDIFNMIKKLYQSQKIQNFTCYRCLKLSSQDRIQFENNMRKRIQLTGFFEAYKNRNQAECEDLDSNYVLIITVPFLKDQETYQNYGYADVEKTSSGKMKFDILFNPFNKFKINKIHHRHQGRNIIQLTYDNQDEKQRIPTSHNQEFSIEQFNLTGQLKQLREKLNIITQYIYFDQNENQRLPETLLNRFNLKCCDSMSKLLKMIQDEEEDNDNEYHQFAIITNIEFLDKVYSMLKEYNNAKTIYVLHHTFTPKHYYLENYFNKDVIHVMDNEDIVSKITENQSELEKLPPFIVLNSFSTTKINLRGLLIYKPDKQAQQDYINLCQSILPSSILDDKIGFTMNDLSIPDTFKQQSIFPRIFCKMLRQCDSSKDFVLLRYAFNQIFNSIKQQYQLYNNENYAVYKNFNINQNQLHLFKENLGKHVELTGFLLMNDKLVSTSSTKNCLLTIFIDSKQIKTGSDFQYGYAKLQNSGLIIFNTFNIFFVQSVIEGEKFYRINLKFIELSAYEEQIENRPPNDFDQLVCFIETQKHLKQSLVNQGDIFNACKQYDDAIHFHEKCMEHFQKGKEGIEYGKSIFQIGKNYQKKGQLSIALEKFKKSLDIFTHNFGQNHELTAGCYNNIGLIYDSLHEYDRALHYYNRCLNVRRQLYEEHHSSIGGIYNNIGSCYYSKKFFQKAIEYYKQALDIYLQIYGKYNPLTGAAFYNLGMAERRRKNFEKALECFQNFYEIRLKQFGQNHNSVILVKEIIQQCKNKGIKQK